jgi:hypothetical protein
MATKRKEKDFLDELILSPKKRKVKKSGWGKKKATVVQYPPLIAQYSGGRKTRPQIDEPRLVTAKYPVDTYQMPKHKPQLAEPTLVNVPYPKEKAAEEERIKGVLKAREEEARRAKSEERQLVVATKKTAAEEAKEAKRQSAIDRYLMGHGSYTKSIANAIKSPDEAKRVFDEQKRRNDEKALKKKETAQARIEKMGGAKFVKAKEKHVKFKHKRLIRKWKKEDEFSPQVTYLVTKRKGKRGTSPIGNVFHKALYPIKHRKKGRW